jgi:hypothetical protein
VTREVSGGNGSYFENVAGFLFLANMSEYNQLVLYEDESKVCSLSLVAFFRP